jgi:hypothetical protein
VTIDPLETIIAWLTNNLTSVEGRVAGKHRYGNGWSEGQTGVSVHIDGGTPDLYSPICEPRLEIRVYADDQVKIVDVWRALIALSRTQERFAVATSKGAALVHNVKPESVLSMLYDEILKMDLGVVFFSAKISEEAV